MYRGGMAFASGILYQAGIAGAKDVYGAVAQPDLQLAGDDNHELASRGWMPVLEITHRGLTKADGGCCLGRGPFGGL